MATKLAHVVMAFVVFHSTSRAFTKASTSSSLATLATLAMASPIVKISFTEATQKRRTIRALESKTTVPDSTVVKLAEAALLTVPSAFDNQSVRLTVLFGNDHKQLWSITAGALLARIGEERWNEGTKDRIANFAGAYGTILFWDDQKCAAAMKEHAPEIYKDKTDEWVQQSNGMHQYYLWTALEALGLGVNLQHYNPLIDAEVQNMWSVPSDWKLKAQMVFGVPKDGSTPGEKLQKLPLEQRLQVFGGKA
ncbi:Nitroreductase [Penicillium psychrosexuale]|uniref:Nitroreductase n=1 Tax=Penicillium psychrosexuale TaxID=1002107 RepID=UPI0025458740|nr:Nitroreductase [Penicillium psychrosexuale]KAJ5799244.1 Nitroreductase [Penicillium psychrosexuale]